MYFRQVNRGISFTKPGLYTLGLVVLLGFFATGSGYNGFFLAAGFGMSLLVISGILSEKVMKNYRCLYLTEATTDANTPFTVDFEVQNAHASWSLLGIENFAVTRLPRFRILPWTITGAVESRVYKLRPGESTRVTGMCRGLPRGLYRHFFVIQRTLYPFGMISKFKVQKINCRICILPSLDRELEERLDVELRRLTQGSRRNEEFLSHRPLHPRDPHRLVDWKKSANLDISQWAVKIFESPIEQFNVLIVVNWSRIQNAFTEKSYEMMLSVVRTACEAAHLSGKEVFLLTSHGHAVRGHENQLEWLGSVPPFDEKEWLSKRESLALPAGAYLNLVVEGTEARWSDTLNMVGAAA